MDRETAADRKRQRALARIEREFERVMDQLMMTDDDEAALKLEMRSINLDRKRHELMDGKRRDARL